MKKKIVKTKKLNPKGFKILLELLIKANYKKIKEIPITFVNRTKGKSKAGVKEIIFYLQNLIRYPLYKNNAFLEFFKFGIVGLIGTFINIGILYLLTEIFRIYYIISAVFSFIVALTNNFILNKIWTFREEIRLNIVKKYLKFSVVSVSALLVNLLFLYIFTEFLGIYYIISQLIAISIAWLINFLGNKIWTFSK